jgi:hypothetical protein
LRRASIRKGRIKCRRLRSAFAGLGRG